MKFSGFILCIAAGLSACASAPELEPQAFPVPNAWPSGLQMAAGASPATHWQQFFPDPQLHQLIGLALENNRDLRIAAARVQEARAQYGVTRADQLPSISALGSGTFSGAPAGLSANSSQRLDLGVSMLSYEADFWGRLASLNEAARFNLLASEEARRSVHISLVADVATSYFAYLQALDSEKTAKLVLASREESLSVIAKGREIGGAYDMEYQLAAGLVEQARSNRDGAENLKNQTLNRLSFLLGNAMPPDIRAARLDDQGLDIALAAGLPSEALLSRPDVMAAEQRLRAANANVGAARAAFMPKVLLTAGLGVASQGLTGLFSGGAWNFIPSITAPLFDNGRLSSSLEVAQARKVIAVADYEKTIQLAFREVVDLLYLRDTLGRQVQSAQLNARTQAKLLQIVQARHQAGLVSFLEVLEAERSYMSALLTISQVRRAQLESAAQLYKALGGGF